MFYARYWIVAVLVCIVFVSDLDAKRMSLEEDLTVLIDYERYQDHVQSQRVQREVAISNDTQSFNPKSSFPVPYPFQKSEQKRVKNSHYHSNECDDDDDECEIKVCDDPVNEVYQKCGGKCVLGCRYAATSSGVSITISKHDCEKNDCVEGCFCKTGLVRHQTKCIAVSECPVRKCNHRYEVYMCGPAAPITCDNALREVEIVHLTKHVECVWGCFCAKGYLRNNYNGKCVPEQECRNTKSVDISPQIPGLFKHLTGCGSKGCGTNNHHESGCGHKGCGSNHVHETGCGSKGCNNEGGHHQHTGAGDSDSDSDSVEYDNGHLDNGHEWAGFQGPVIHVHKWNDTGKLQLSGATINGTCIGTNACSGEFSGLNNHAPGSVSSGTPLTTVPLANGTTITTPVETGGTIDIESGTINTGATLGDEYDEMESEEAVETDAPQVNVPMKIPMANRTEIPSGITPPKGVENKKPQLLVQTPVQTAVYMANNKPQVPLQIPIAVTSPVKPINGNLQGNQKPNSMNENEAQPTYTPPANGNNLGQRPQFSFAPYVPNNYFANQQTPNNGIHTPFIINPFVPFNKYPANPNFGFNPNTATNSAPNTAPNAVQHTAPNTAPNVRPFAAPFFGTAQPQFVPQNFYNRPIVTAHTQKGNVPNKGNTEAEDSSSEETQEDDDDESKSEEYESNSSEESHQQKPQTIPPKKNENVPANTGASGSKVPPHYQAYFDFLNQFTMNQGNPSQVNPNRMNPNQFISSQASHGVNPSQPNPNQFLSQFHQNQFNPNQLNSQPISNQYYPNSFNAPNTNGFPHQSPQFTVPNPQFTQFTQYNQYNPYNNPFSTESVNAFLNQANANIGNFFKPGNPNPPPNRQIINKPSRKHQTEPTTNQYYTYNRKHRPNTDKKEAEVTARPQNKPQNSPFNQKPNVSYENNKKSEEVPY